MDVEMYFDFSCPYAYLASVRIEHVIGAHGARLIWRPMLLGGVFRAQGQSEFPQLKMPLAKALHNKRDMLRWADHLGVPLSQPAAHPMRTVRALRALLSLPEELWPSVIHGVFQAYWVHGLDITTAPVIGAILEEAGMTDALRSRAEAANEDEGIKEELRRRTDEAVARGVFGAPTFFAAGIMLWGQDRIGMLERILDGWRPEVHS